MVQLVHESAETQAIAQQDELVYRISTLLPHSREEADRLAPFCVGELGLPCEGVEVVDEGRE